MACELLRSGWGAAKAALGAAFAAPACDETGGCDGETNCNPDGSALLLGACTAFGQSIQGAIRRTFLRDVRSERPSLRQPESDAESRLDWD